MTKKITTSYEILAIFAGSLRESELKKELEKLETELARDAKILNKTVWSARQLAYKISGEMTGNYFVAHFNAEPKMIAALDNALRLDPKIIRHIITKTPKNYEWREYSDEDLEHDFAKLEKTEPAPEPRFAKKKTATKKSVAEKFVPATKKSPAKKVEAKVDAGAIDKKLDDILADL